MLQIIINYLYIFGLPIIVGLAARILLRRLNKAYFVTVAFAILALIALVVAIVVPSYGSEMYGIMTIQAIAALVSSLLTGLVLRLRSKIRSEDRE